MVPATRGKSIKVGCIAKQAHYSEPRQVFSRMWYSFSPQYNKSINVDRFYTLRRRLNGDPVFLKRKTARKKVRKAIVAMRTWCRNNRHKPLLWQYRILASKLRGHFQYFGVRCNMRLMEAVRHQAIRGWRYWLSRRSHKSAIPWEKFEKLLELCPLPTPKIVHNV